MTHIGLQTMKSIVEEASSIVRAIEKAWERAERPQEFTIKIFEDVQRGFLGMTKKQAKVGIFFAENPVERSREGVRENMREKTTMAPFAERERPREHKQVRESQVIHEKRKPQAPIAPLQSEDTIKERRSPWTTDMENAVESWLIQLMQRGALPQISFALKRVGNRLHITFAKPLFDAPEKNIALFRSLSYLLLGMLRSKFKKEFRFLKVVLTADA